MNDILIFGGGVITGLIIGFLMGAKAMLIGLVKKFGHD